MSMFLKWHQLLDRPEVFYKQMFWKTAKEFFFVMLKSKILLKQDQIAVVFLIILQYFSKDFVIEHIQVIASAY